MITSRLIRRSFATSTRLLQKPGNKPPVPPPPPNETPNEPPAPRNDHEPPKDNASTDGELRKLKEKLVGTFKPSSEDFLLAFANPKLAKEKRWKSFLLFSAATILALLIPDPFKGAAQQSEDEHHQKDSMLEMIQTAFIERDRVDAGRRASK
ncbi:hypothetical protein FB567DRAFT_599105 [Paraphoma chrysanthemicola]|uniref:Uncharacterized protein n=1 Tax=Paraphoma chrysanthemicola TaxID=798071 RepID=A0A8K0QTA9_9PLEO|nr:hypothetical protein FB567DRAFT_599105 [Paraphoma chrysanthemicola]